MMDTVCVSNYVTGELLFISARQHFCEQDVRQADKCINYAIEQ